MYASMHTYDAVNRGNIFWGQHTVNILLEGPQDGLLREVANPPLNLAGRLTARLKVMSRMNIAERRVPQDGRIKLKLSASRDIDFRVNTLPTLYGEKVVLRILESAGSSVGINKLGMDPDQQEIFLRAIKRPYGMILVTGPTGSGKTVTL